MGVRLRPYQEEAVKAIEDGLERGVDRPLVALPTGTGKTVVAGEVIRRRGGRALVIAHRDELLKQARDKIVMISPGTDVGMVKASENEVDSDVVVASIQTISRSSRLEQLARSFDTVFVDEAHHSASDTYVRVLEHVSDSDLIIGMTATPERGDRKKLEDVWQEVVYEWDLLSAIESGYLAPLRGLRVRTDAEFGKFRTVRGDFVASEVEEELDRVDAPARIVEAFSEHASERKAIVFAPGVDTSRRLSEAFCEAGYSAAHVDGSTPQEERETILRRFSEGEHQLLCNVGIATEGYDEPSVDCIVNCAPTKSKIRYVQTIGRGTRTHPGKDDCLVIDMVGNSDRMDVMSTASLFGLTQEQAYESDMTVVEAVAEAARIELEEAEQAEREGRLKAEQVDLFRKRYHEAQEKAQEHFGSRGGHLNWLAVDDMWALGLGQRGIIVLVPSNQGDWDVALLSKRNEFDALGGSMDVGYAQGAAEDFIREDGSWQLAERDVSWRYSEASSGQLDYVGNMMKHLEDFREVYADREFLTKGEAADLITTALVRRAFSTSAYRGSGRRRSLQLRSQA